MTLARVFQSIFEKSCFVGVVIKSEIMAAKSATQSIISFF